MTGHRVEDEDQEPPEHYRYRHYLRALEQVSEADEAALVASVLRDPDTAMAQAAVNRHIECRAADLLTGAAFTAWARGLAPLVDGSPFLSGRLREWTLLRAVALDEPWTAEELIGASDWFQRTASVAEVVTSPEALDLLAERGRTRRVRNAASRRLPPQRRQPG